MKFPLLALHFLAWSSPAVTALSLLKPSSPSKGRYTSWAARFGSDYTHQTFLGANDDVAIHWKIEDGTLHLAVAAGASGWVGFGIAEAGGMPGADIIVFEAAAETLKDYHAIAYARPVLDQCQDDWTLVGSTSKNSFIAFRATRALATGDPQDRDLTFDDSDLFDPPTPIIAAWSDEPVLSYHGRDNRDGGFVRFYGPEGLQAGDASQLEEASSGSFIVSAQNYVIPTNETTYYDFCVNIADLSNAPDFENGVHLIGVDLAASVDVNGIDSAEYVHHFALFGRPFTCDVIFSPQIYFYGWGPRQPPFILPDNVGLPVGGTSGFKSFGMQIHYDNPKGVQGVLDSTGVRLYYSAEPRQDVANAMIVGDTFTTLRGQSVGAGATQHDFFCPSNCTASNLPAPVTVFSESMHTHETATRTVNQVIRDGAVVHESIVDFWDFRRAGIKIVQQEPYELRPGDEFRTTCYFENEDNSTQFGLGTREEMCQAIVFFYPGNALSHGFCGPGLIDFLGDPLCEASYQPMTAAADFDRVFGMAQEEECVSGSSSSSSE